MTPAGTSNELDVQNEWEENTHTHTCCVDDRPSRMNTFENRVVSIEPTAVHRCARKITEFASGIVVLMTRDAAHKGFFC